MPGERAASSLATSSTSTSNPFTRTSFNATQNQFNNQNQQQAQFLNSQNIGAGAFGGDRAGVSQAILAGQQQLSRSARDRWPQSGQLQSGAGGVQQPAADQPRRIGVQRQHAGPDGQSIWQSGGGNWRAWHSPSQYRRARRDAGHAAGARGHPVYECWHVLRQHRHAGAASWPSGRKRSNASRDDPAERAAGDRYRAAKRLDAGASLPVPDDGLPRQHHRRNRKPERRDIADDDARAQWRKSSRGLGHCRRLALLPIRRSPRASAASAARLCRRCR